MDPVLFRIDWETLFEVLGTMVVLSFFVERALAVVVESRIFIDSRIDKQGVKEILSLALSYAVILVAKFDAIAAIFKLETQSAAGYFITAAVIAGGSKASLKLFHDILDIKSDALRQKQVKNLAAVSGDSTAGQSIAPSGPQGGS